MELWNGAALLHHTQEILKPRGDVLEEEIQNAFFDYGLKELEHELVADLEN